MKAFVPAARPRDLSSLRKGVSIALAVAWACLTVLPFLFMISLSLQSDQEILSGFPVLLPAHAQFRNYVDIWGLAPFARFLLNSLIMAGGITISHFFLDPLAGYTFAKLQFPGRRFLFGLLLATMMLPFFIRLIPLYMIVARLHWVNTYQGMIVPFLTSAFGIFLMRQFIQSIPDELLDAGRIDGCSEFGVFWQIVLPNCGPAVATNVLFTFVFQWNEFLWPLVVANTMNMRTMTIGLTLFNLEHFSRWNMTATGGVILFVPALILFLFTQRRLVSGAVLSGFR